MKHLVNQARESAIPEPASLIETFRAIGYSPEAAVADLLDNSISADARNIWIDFLWNGEDSWLRIRDDGHGMSDDALKIAMKPGSRNPREERDSKDLGRFGLGLKTASFSQTKQFSVASKAQDGTISHWTWDLDLVQEIGKWEIVKYFPDEGKLEDLDSSNSGTIVFWPKLDRITKNLSKNSEKAQKKFYELMERIKKHQGMVFHRFITEKKITIFFQGREVEPWDPFLSLHPQTQITEDQYFQNKHGFMKGYILPHKSRLSEIQFKETSGINGWNDHQGFYIYRGARLLVAGDWLGLYKKEEHFKLARIKIDLDNTLDSPWQIDIKKSTARPPIEVKAELKQYADSVRRKASEVYRHRGKRIKKLSGIAYEPLWEEKIKSGVNSFEINRDHPAIQLLKDTLSQDQKALLNGILLIIEKSIPHQSIYINEATNSEIFNEENDEKNLPALNQMVKELYNSFIQCGLDKESAISKLSQIEPFNQFPTLIGTI